ncbi:MAG: hypothetical protein N2C12_13655 [Planctomycetales bacterium]
MISRNTLFKLLVTALVLPIFLSVVWAVAHLLQAMGDLLWYQILLRVALLGSIAWVIELICLLLALAMHAMGPPDSSNDSPDGD